MDGDYREDEIFVRLRRDSAALSPALLPAIPPSMFRTVIEGLNKSGCARGARVVVEKPFGRDLASAQALNRTLHSVFDESAIFRIDHPRKRINPKPAVLSIRQFLPQPIWNREYVDSVQITMAEQFRVSGRGVL